MMKHKTLLFRASLPLCKKENVGTPPHREKCCPEWSHLAQIKLLEQCLQPSKCARNIHACAQSCPTLWDPMNCNLPGFSVCGILQARILEWVVMPSFKGSSQPRDWTRSPALTGTFFTVWATREVPLNFVRLAKRVGNPEIWEGKVVKWASILSVFLNF